MAEDIDTQKYFDEACVKSTGSKSLHAINTSNNDTVISRPGKHYNTLESSTASLFDNNIYSDYRPSLLSDSDADDSVLNAHSFYEQQDHCSSLSSSPLLPNSTSFHQEVIDNGNHYIPDHIGPNYFDTPLYEPTLPLQQQQQPLSEHLHNSNHSEHNTKDTITQQHDTLSPYISDFSEHSDSSLSSSPTFQPPPMNFMQRLHHQRKQQQQQQQQEEEQQQSLPAPINNEKKPVTFSSSPPVVSANDDIDTAPYNAFELNSHKGDETNDKTKMYESQEATARTDESTSPLELVSTQQHCTDDSTNENDYQHTDLDLAEKTNVDGVNSNDDVSSDDIYHFNEHRVKSPVYDSLSSDILAKNDLFDLTDNDTDDNLDLSSSNCFVLDSQPESSYVMGDEYGFSDKSHSPSSDQQQLTTTTNDESTKTRSPVLPEHSIGHDDNRSSLDLMIHCSNSPPKIGRLQQRDISDFMSSEPEPVYQESVEKRRKLKSPKRELDRQHQRQLHQTELDVFYSQLSSGSSLSTAKSFFDDDDDTQLSNTKSSQTRQKDANTLSSLEQLRVEKQSKRSTQSPNEKQQWMSTLSMPRTKSSLSPCTQQKDNKSQEVEEEKGMNRMKRNTKMATTSVMTDPSKPRQRSYGLSKPRSISSAKRTTPSISALITGQHGPSLQPCDVIVKTGKIGSRKKTLGMTRRFNIYK